MDIYKYRVLTGNIPGKYTPFPCGDVIYGCTDTDAVNFNPAATVNQVSETNTANPCTYTVNLSGMCCGTCLDCFDFTGDGVISVGDLNVFLQYYYTVQPDCTNGDATNSGYVNEEDLNIFLQCWNLTNNPIDCQTTFAGQPDAIQACLDANSVSEIPQEEEKEYLVQVYLDQDFNDIGHYSLTDGKIQHKSDFSNFAVFCDDTNPNMVTVENSTNFNLWADTQNYEYTIEWGDGTTTVAQYPTILNSHTYNPPPPAFTGTYEINITMVTNWSTLSVTQTHAIPCETPDITGSNITQTYQFTPLGGAPISLDWYNTSWGPLDSGFYAEDYITGNYTTTPFIITGITDSVLSNFQTYSQAPSNNAYLPNGYFVGPNFLVPFGGEVAIDNGGVTIYEDGLVGYIMNATPNYTAYTISDGTGQNGGIVLTDQMIDGELITIYEATSEGLNLQNMGWKYCYKPCDDCMGPQMWINGQMVNVSIEAGEWDENVLYSQGSLVTSKGCCYFNYDTAQGQSNNPSNTDIWQPCPSQPSTCTSVLVCECQGWTIQYGASPLATMCQEFDALQAAGFGYPAGSIVEFPVGSGVYYWNVIAEANTPPNGTWELCDAPVNSPIVVELNLECCDLVAEVTNGIAPFEYTFTDNFNSGAIIVQVPGVYNTTQMLQQNLFAPGPTNFLVGQNITVTVTDSQGNTSTDSISIAGLQWDQTGSVMYPPTNQQGNQGGYTALLTGGVFDINCAPISFYWAVYPPAQGTPPTTTFNYSTQEIYIGWHPTQQPNGLLVPGQYNLRVVDSCGTNIDVTFMVPNIPSPPGPQQQYILYDNNCLPYSSPFAQQYIANGGVIFDSLQACQANISQTPPPPPPQNGAGWSPNNQGNLYNT
tara:strand:- start:35011 stop:37632 length:2622 start_codon:yes stop_codon:yes gene_type:complete